MSPFGGFRGLSFWGFHLHHFNKLLIGLSVVVPQQCSFMLQALLFAAATTAHPAAFHQYIFFQLSLCTMGCAFHGLRPFHGFHPWLCKMNPVGVPRISTPIKAKLFPLCLSGFVANPNFAKQNILPPFINYIAYKTTRR